MSFSVERTKELQWGVTKTCMISPSPPPLLGTEIICEFFNLSQFWGTQTHSRSSPMILDWFVCASESRFSCLVCCSYAGAVFADACLKGLNGIPDIVECTFVQSSVTELPFFASKVIESELLRFFLLVGLFYLLPQIDEDGLGLWFIITIGSCDGCDQLIDHVCVCAQWYHFRLLGQLGFYFILLSYLSV